LRNNSKKYTLIGGVGKTGPYPLLQQTTVLDALAAAGGFKDFSNPKKIVIMRGTQKFKFNYKDVIHGKHMEQNITLEDGDLIVVPE
jgi:polysaccharide export outer membrane protein